MPPFEGIAGESGLGHGPIEQTAVAQRLALAQRQRLLPPVLLGQQPFEIRGVADGVRIVEDAAHEDELAAAVWWHPI